ncbi:RING finger protein 10-like [Dendronephthya gigantea]|uniref:RING finger protein 10-like n=1 Tax=Dendronephthya gigantea TaxID=151771 RepID=UPI00106A5E48|nr:RING finger protein 10-like [Dendronephthya gigantea]
MGDGLQNMEGANQYIRPSRTMNNSPTTQRQGNSPKSLAKVKNGQLKSQKLSKGGFPLGTNQRNPPQERAKGYQNSQRKGNFAYKHPPAKALRQTERFNPLAVQDGEMQLDYDFPVTPLKKDVTSLNHLLNFTYAPLQQNHHHHGWTNRRKVSGKWNQYNKEQFLQANCQFVVQANGDYAVNLVDPDVIVDWELIEQVRVRCKEMPSCPICLYPPTAAQMTRCGHIYCWSCILHYLSLSEKTWKKCPICYEAVHKKDLKSVMAVSDHTHNIGQQITMTLMKRAKYSVFAMPTSKWEERTSIPHLSPDGTEMQFSKLLIASPEEVLNEIMAKEKSELESQLIGVIDDESGEEEYVKLAIEQFEEKEKKLLEICERQPQINNSDNVGEVNSLVGTHDGCMDDIEHASGEENPASGERPVDNSSGEVHVENPGGEDVHGRTSISSDDSTCSSLSSENSQFYYFYQAEDGQHIFLHPVNARCLIKEYGSLENCPQTIEGDIVEIECHTQTEELRRRFRYLRHLPLTCEFAICEIDLKPPTVSWETLQYFKDDIRKRHLQRQKKAKEEAKHDNKCKSKMTTFTGTKHQRNECVAIETPNLDSEKDFPQQVGSGPNVWISSSPPAQGPWSCGRTGQESAVSGASFAKALSSGKPTPPRCPPQKTRTQSEGSHADANDKSSDQEPDECEPIPSFQSAFTDALMMAADLNLNIPDVSQESKTLSRRERRKRSKAKEKKLLFSTGNSAKL